MAAPRLTFFTELDGPGLEAMLTPAVIGDLAALKAAASIALVDLSPERARAVQALNRAGVPVVAWLVLEKDQGYYCNQDNPAAAAGRYAAFREWTQANHLSWQGVGLDIEPDLAEFQRFGRDPWRSLPRVLRRAVQPGKLRHAERAYRDLCDQIRRDGYRVDSYIFPIIWEDRQAGSTLLRRLTGLVDVPADREVLMLYTSFMRSIGAGVLGSYGPQAQSIGVGSTGGGVETTIGDDRPLEWAELARDLRLAWYFTSDLHLFSLEGCVRQGFLPRLKTFTWDEPILLPEAQIERTDRLRGAAASFLWLASRFPWILAGALGGYGLAVALRRRLRE